MTEQSVSTLLFERVPLFEGLPQHDLVQLVKSAHRKSFPRGAAVLKAGDPPQHFFVLVSGLAHAVMTDSAGNQVILSILKAGDYFCDAELIGDTPMSCSIVARHSCDFLVIGKAAFAQLVRANFSVTRNLLTSLLRRTRSADARFANLAVRSLDERLADFLICEAELVDGSRIVKSQLTNSDIGNMIGASREGVSRAMKGLCSRGYLERRGKSIVLSEEIVGFAAA